MSRFSSVRLRRARATGAPCVIYRWDLDKTYLKSEIDSLRELVKIPFERAEDKVATPGVATLIRVLRDVASRGGREVRVYFISASPPQIGRAIKDKLDLDGVVHDGIVFKNQMQRLIRGKFRHLREQVGFKLTELLKARRGDPRGAREYLFGDDWESDPLIYSLYADVLAGGVGAEDLAGILRAVRVDEPLVDEACTLANEVLCGDAVARIFINLERRTPPASFHPFGGRLVPTFNYFQTAACLFEEGVLDKAAVADVGRSLIDGWAYSREQLANSLADIQRRGHLGRESALVLRADLRDAELLPADPRGRAGRWWYWWERLWARLRAVPAEGQAAGPVLVDYRTIVGAGGPSETSTE